MPGPAAILAREMELYEERADEDYFDGLEKVIAKLKRRIRDLEAINAEERIAALERRVQSLEDDLAAELEARAMQYEGREDVEIYVGEEWQPSDEARRIVREETANG